MRPHIDGPHSVGVGMNETRDGEWRQVDALFDAALSVPVAERSALLEECTAADTVRDEVRRLLRLHDAAEARIGESAEKIAGAVMMEEPDAVPPEFGAGDPIGPYTVVRELGRGGMGTVYLAERMDDRYERHVALKVVKRGMDTDEIL